MTKDLTREQLLRNFENLQNMVDTAATQEIKDDAAQWLHVNRIAYYMLTGHTELLPVATAYEDIDNSEALQIDGTWYRCEANGCLQALDDTDCIWYDIDMVDDDPDVTLYYYDIRAQLMAV